VFRSGWWVAAAAVPVTLFGLWLVITQFNQRSGGPAPLDLASLTCPSDELADAVAVASARRSLPTVHDPEVFPGSEIPARNAAKRGKVLVDFDRVVGVAFGGEARAYPLRLLRWHEVVNDTVGGRAIAVTYSGLCDAVVVYDRAPLGPDSDLEISGHVLDSNALLTDGKSVWRQLSGQAMAGPAACTGTSLMALPAAVATWAAWFEAHPESTVMAPVPGMESSYKRDPYHSYFGSDVLHFPVDPLASGESRPLKARIVGWEVDGATTWLPMAEYTSPAVQVGDRTFQLTVTGEPHTTWIDPAEPGAPAMRHAFWFAWYAQFDEAGPTD
jgi:hypothetical protein